MLRAVGDVFWARVNVYDAVGCDTLRPLMGTLHHLAAARLS